MKSKYLVRFAPTQNKKFESPQQSSGHSDVEPWAVVLADPKRPRRAKSRYGCAECKTRRVKCDETFPVCLRCQRRGSVCQSNTPPMQWNSEMPWLTSATINDPWAGCASSPNKRLLQHWMESSSQMMSLDRNDNPLSFPLLEHLVSHPALVHAVQSVSAGHEVFFDQSKLETCFEERGQALELVRKEFQNSKKVQPGSLLAVFILGISASWTETKPICYGKEHLIGARTMLGIVLENEDLRYDKFTLFILGWYLYWDMACSFIAEPDDLLPLNTPRIFEVLQETQKMFHPMTGFSTELFYLIGNVGRHCRQVLDDGERDPTLEATLEEQLLSWQPNHDDEHLVDLSRAYRNHGLIMLYGICGRQPNTDPLNAFTIAADPDLESTIRSYALETIHALLDTPIGAPGFNFHSIPLLTAGAELTSEDSSLRMEVVNRFMAVYSSNRIAVNLWAVELLKETWTLCDLGIHISWLEVMIQKQWKLSFA